MAASYGPEPSRSHLVLLLLGEKHSGKSSAGNAILGRAAFPRKTTTRSSREESTVCGKQVTVVDTPGWLSHSATPDQVSRELCRALTLGLTQPHVILLVLPITSTFGQGQWRAMETQLRLLQTPIWQRAMVLFTHWDKLGSVSVQDYLQTQDQTLLWLLERCGNRHQVMSRLGSRVTQKQVGELFEKIHGIIQTNSRPREAVDRMYTHLRQEVSMRVERTQDVEMTVIRNWRERRWRRMSSGGLDEPRGQAAGQDGFRPPLCLILLGRRRSGKSLAGNKILGREVFQVDSKTTRCSVDQGDVSGRPVTVVDTPGWSLFGLGKPEEVQVEIIRSVSLRPFGSKVCFLLVVPVDSFREKDRKAAEKHLGLLGTDVWGRTVVLFTYGEQLRGRRVEAHIRAKGEALQWVMDRCGQRHQVFDANTRDGTQVDQLLEMVQRL